MNTLYVDVETSGLVKYLNGIISLSYIIDDEDGNELTRGTIEMNPLTYSKKVSDKALEVNGYKLEDLDKLQDGKTACKQFIDVLNKYYSGEKYKLVAYNADFDAGFVSHWMDKMYPDTYWRIIDYKHLDPFAVIKYLQYIGKINTGKSQSLVSVCNMWDIEIEAHNSMSDINATRVIHKRLIEEFL